MIKSPANLLERIEPVDPDKIMRPKIGHDIWTVAWMPPVPNSELVELRHMDGIQIIKDAFSWSLNPKEPWEGWMAVEFRVLIWNKEEIAQ